MGIIAKKKLIICKAMLTKWVLVSKKAKIYIMVMRGKSSMKDFNCSKEGLKNNELCGKATYNRSYSRTGCKAII